MDKNNVLTGWTADKGKKGAFCGWDFVVCDAAGKNVEVSPYPRHNAAVFD